MAKTEKEVEGQSDSVDTNNNTGKTQNDSSSNSPTAASGGKYQLRPRSLQARRHSDSEWSLQDTLRHKPRPQPLSRYRRKTANARERYRMRQINTAFESLRGVLPSWVCSRRAAADMTKIATLRLASAYIRSLQDILDGNAPEDTCTWVISSILGEDSASQESKTKFQFQEYQPNLKVSGPDKIQHTASDSQQDPDLVSLLCTSSDTGVFQDNLETFSYLTPMSESEAVALLLGERLESRVERRPPHARGVLMLTAKATPTLQGVWSLTGPTTITMTSGTSLALSPL